MILETLRRGEGVVIRARQNDNNVGLAVAHMLRHPPVLFVVYLADIPNSVRATLARPCLKSSGKRAAADTLVKG